METTAIQSTIYFPENVPKHFYYTVKSPSTRYESDILHDSHQMMANDCQLA